MGAKRLTAIVGAGGVVCLIGLTACGGSHPSTTTANQAAAVARTVTVTASSRTARSRAAAPVEQSASGATSSAANAAPSSPRASGPPPNELSATPVAGSPAKPALGHLPVSGQGLVLVMDQPSGPFAQQNTLIRQGIIVALDQLDANGGVDHHQVRLVTENLDGLSATALRGRLQAAGPNAILVLPCDSDSQSTLATAAAADRAVMFAPCDADASLADQLSTYWPVGMSGDEEAAGLVNVLEALGYSSAYVVNTPGSDYAASMTENFRAAAHANGMRVVGSGSVPLQASASDISRLAGAIRAARPQPAAVFSALPPPYIDSLAAGLVHDGVRAYVVGTSAMDTPSTLSSTDSSYLENATFPSYGFLRQTPQTSAFVQEYKARFGQPVGAFPGLGFDTVGLLEAAITKARSTTPAAIQQALLSGINDPGVALFARSYDSRTNHNPVTTVSVEKIYDDSFEPLQTVQPSGVPPA